MILPSEGHIVTDRRKPTKLFLYVFLGIIAIASLALGVFGLNQYLKNQALIEDEKIINQIISEAQSMEFTFTAVPDAVALITLPEPSDTNQIDAEVYARLKSPELVAAEVVQNDVAFNMSFQGVTLIEYFNSLDNPSEIYQVFDELHELTLLMNAKFNRPPLAARIPGVVQMAELDPISPGSDTRSVYPSIRAVDAYMAAEFMSGIDPDNKEVYLREAQALVDRGIMYGLYGVSDADAAKEIVTQYLEIYNKIVANPS